MTKNKNARTCMFYVSDYHFEMIGLLNIKKEIEENKEVIIISENNLEKSIKKLLSSINFKEKDKNKIEKINWNNNNEEKYLIIKRLIKKGQNISVYIKGDEEYISNQNKKLKNIISEFSKEIIEEKIKIIDCYDFSKLKQKSQEIVKNYEINLVTGKEIKL